MPREPATYRLHLERLNELFPGKESLTYKEAASYLNKSERTAISRLRSIHQRGIGITKVDLAYKIASGCNH